VVDVLELVEALCVAEIGHYVFIHGRALRKDTQFDVRHGGTWPSPRRCRSSQQEETNKKNRGCVKR
jgi:hypothetical protein